jgi:hypothetical protein
LRSAQTASRVATRGAAATTCSQLSSTRSRCRPTSADAKIDEGGAIGEFGGKHGRDGESEASLADSARPSQRQQAEFLPEKEVPNRGDLALPADERRERNRKLPQPALGMGRGEKGDRCVLWAVGCRAGHDPQAFPRRWVRLIHRQRSIGGRQGEGADQIDGIESVVACQGG